jgi:hypothetical protein
MKETITMLFFLISSGSLFAQDRRNYAPDQVQQSFHKDYPEANNARWSRKHNQWHAQFNDKSPTDRGEMVAHYNPNGQHIDSHIPYDQNDVPSPVRENVQRKYRGARNFRFTEIEQPSENGFFQVTINLHGKDKNIYMDEQGQERKYNDHH